MRLIIAVAVLIFSLISITTQEERLAYLTYLLNQKQLLQDQISRMEAINRNLNINIKLNDQQNFKQTWTASAIRDQHQVAADALATTFVPLSQKSNNCIVQENQFGHKISDIQSQLDKVRPIIERQASCFRNDYIRINYNFYQTISDGFKQETVNDCKGTSTSNLNSTIPFLNIKETKFVPYTDSANPWIYGLITPYQYKSKKNQLMNLYGAVECPSNTPFLDENNNCKFCSNNQIYDISQKQCKTCETGTFYNSVTHQCEKIYLKFNSNLTDNQNYVGTLPNIDSQIGFCPNDKPYFNGLSCISCSPPMYFSFITNLCQQCQNETIFDLKSKLCKSVSFYLSNLTGSENYIGSSLSPLPYDSIQTCPSQTPFSNGKQCFACSLPKFFNFQRMTCQQCPNKFNFDIKSHSCVGTGVTMMNSNLIDNRNFIGKIPLYSNLYKNCEANTPFFNGKECISCLLPSYFDFDTLTCTSCLKQLSFNIVIQICEYINQDYFTDISVKNIYYNGNFNDIKVQIDQKKSKNTNMKVCHSNSPFYNSRTNTCISCTDQLPLFDIKNNKCIICPSGSQFDQTSHICLTKKVGATIERMIMNTA